MNMVKLILLCMICVVMLILGCSQETTTKPDADSFDVVITAVGQRKIIAIKGVREVTGLGLKDAKDLVDGVPATVRKDLTREDAEQIAQKLSESDLTVEVRPQ
jgi:ribosomal protein L7/L12